MKSRLLYYYKMVSATWYVTFSTLHLWPLTTFHVEADRPDNANHQSQQSPVVDDVEEASPLHQVMTGQVYVPFLFGSLVFSSTRPTPELNLWDGVMQKMGCHRFPYILETSIEREYWSNSTDFLLTSNAGLLLTVWKMWPPTWAMLWVHQEAETKVNFVRRVMTLWSSGYRALSRYIEDPSSESESGPAPSAVMDDVDEASPLHQATTGQVYVFSFVLLFIYRVFF